MIDKQEILDEFHSHFPIYADKGIESKEFQNYEKTINESKDRKQRVVRVICGHCGVGKSRRLFQEWAHLPDKKKIKRYRIVSVPKIVQTIRGRVR